MTTTTTTTTTTAAAATANGKSVSRARWRKMASSSSSCGIKQKHSTQRPPVLLFEKEEETENKNNNASSMMMSRRKQLLMSGATMATTLVLEETKPETTRRVAFGGENDALQSRKYKPFAGKASNAFAFEVPADWVVAIDRPVEEKQRRRKAETKVVVGQFKTIDTMSVRLEIADDSVKKAFELAEKEKDATYIEREFTKEEREAAAGKIAQDVIVGVENNKSGVMKFVDVSDDDANTTRRIERDGKTYYVFQSISEVCRAEITEIGGGKKICIGPRGDEIDTIERRAMTLVSVPDANDNSYFVLKMSAKVDRWEETKENFEHAAETFRLL
tara:strand:+ start:193 stop:1185 length:993 start_codon:yes stop_codon:yes gene_type:complete